MKQVFYSEKLQKYFDSEEECKAEEEKFDKALAEKEQAKEARAKDASDVEEAYRNALAVRKEVSRIIADAKREVDEADREYFKARREFVNKYGSFHMTYSSDSDDGYITVGDWFDAIKNMFLFDFNN